MIAVIKSAIQYEEMLARVTELALADPAADSAYGKELEVLVVLIQEYERRLYPLAAPSPLAAIRQRLDQRGLASKDLVPFLGSRSKVSEVMSGKRSLSLNMIRALHDGLGIPLESLISTEKDDSPIDEIEWDRFPVRELLKLKWVTTDQLGPKAKIGFTESRDIMEAFFRPIGGVGMANYALHKTDRVVTATPSDKYALVAWEAYVRRRAEGVAVAREFRVDDWGSDGLRELRALSRFDVGPRLAVQYLRERGIIVDIVPHLAKTRLDGAALRRSDGTPVIALTLRYDRVDNFWFTLFHELMHVVHHLWTIDPNRGSFLDDLDMNGDLTPVESEADELAREALVPAVMWNTSAVRYSVAPVTVNQLALQIGVSDAVVAGRVRRERKNYRLLSSMVGAGEVRKLFPDERWSE